MYGDGKGMDQNDRVVFDMLIKTERKSQHVVSPFVPMGAPECQRLLLTLSEVEFLCVFICRVH